MTHLDTSYLIDLLRENGRGIEGPATRALEELSEDELGVSVHVACELHAGAAQSADPQREHGRVEALLSALWRAEPGEAFPIAYGRTLAKLRRRGETVSTMDLLIATAALVDGAALVTRNVRDFERIPGLTVISY